MQILVTFHHAPVCPLCLSRHSVFSLEEVGGGGICQGKERGIPGEGRLTKGHSTLWSMCPYPFLLPVFPLLDQQLNRSNLVGLFLLPAFQATEIRF